MNAAVNEAPERGQASTIWIPGLAERASLVRFCHRLTGDPDAAEDLVQETLLEAWRKERELRDPERRTAWLFGIARNICARWGRARGRELGRTVTPRTDTRTDEAVDTDVDVEMDLERSELAELLDRALAYLSPETRQLLLQRYINDLSNADIARRMRISEGAVAVRLHRGRLALRRVLATDLREEAASYGLLAGGEETWEQTRIWCPTCGGARLEAFRSIESRTFLLRCPGCRSETSDHSATYLGEVRGHTRTMIRSNREAHAFYSAALEAGEAPCCICGRSLPLRRFLPEQYAGTLDRTHGVQLRCERCNIVSFQPVTGLALVSPVVERFWRRHRRVRTLPVRECEIAGRVALEATFQSVTDSTYVTVVTAADTFEVIDIRGNGSLGREEQA